MTVWIRLGCSEKVKDQDVDEAHGKVMDYTDYDTSRGVANILFRGVIFCPPRISLSNSPW